MFVDFLQVVIKKNPPKIQRIIMISYFINAHDDVA